MQPTNDHASQAISAEWRSQELAIRLPVPPEPFGTYTEAVQVGSLLFLSGTLPAEGRTAKFVGGWEQSLTLRRGRDERRRDRSPASRLAGSRETNRSPRRGAGVKKIGAINMATVTSTSSGTPARYPTCYRTVAIDDLFTFLS